MTERERYNSVVEMYLENVKSNGRSPETVSAYKCVLDMFGRYVPDTETESGTIGMDAVMAWKHDVAERGTKATTIAYYLNILRVFFEWATDQAVGLYKSSPISKALIPKNSNIQKPLYSKLLTEREYMELFKSQRPKRAWLSYRMWLRNRAMLMLLLTTGMRNGDLRCLTPDDLDYENACIRIVNGKGGRTRYVPFDELAQIAVRNYLTKTTKGRPPTLPSDEPLFGTKTGDGGWKPLSRQGVSKIIRQTVEDLCGRDNITSHAVRHNAASFWLSAGAPLADIQAVLGHNSIATTQIYAERLNEHEHVNNIAKLMRVKEYYIQQENEEASLFDKVEESDDSEVQGW